MKPPERKTKIKLGKAVKKILSYTPPEPPKKPKKQPSKAELERKYRLDV